MTRAREIHELIAENVPGPADRKSFEHVAGKLEDQLGKDVPFRPEFKAELRQRLMAQARQQSAPWYRRPAVFAGGLGVAAAAAVLAIGLSMFRTVPGPTPGAGSSPSTPPQVTGPGTTSYQPIAVGKANLPVVSLPDEKLAPEVIGPESTATESPTTLKAIHLNVRGTADDAAAIAGGLGLTAPAKQTAEGWEVTQGTQRLTVSADGRVTYADTNAATAHESPTGGVEGARAVARRFLDRAKLPVVDRAPTVSETDEGARKLYTVVFTQRIENRPVLNARVVVQVTEYSGVVSAEAYLSASQEDRGPFDAVPMAEAVKAAEQRGGGITFAGADLVWVRTMSDGSVDLQPYWRVFGTDAQGGRLARYVPALQHNP